MKEQKFIKKVNIAKKGQGTLFVKNRNRVGKIKKLIDKFYAIKSNRKS